MLTLLRIGMLCAFLCFGETASAHATPVLYEPDSSSILSDLPDAVHIRFSERVDPAASSVHVFAPDGTEVQTNTGIIDAKDAHDFSAAFRHAGSGTYTVSWQVVSADDGHFTKGGFQFSLGKETTTPLESGERFQVEHRSDWWEAITIGLELLGNAVFIACLVLISFLWRPMQKNALRKETTDISGRLRVLMLCAAGSVVFGTIGYLFVESVNLAIDQAVSVPQAFHSFLFTVAGRTTILRLLLGIMLAASSVVSISALLEAKKPLRREWIFWLIIIAIALLRTSVSHSAASSFLPTLSIFVNTVHLLCKDLWIGALVVFFFVFLPVLDQEKNAQRTMQSLLRFSKILMIALGMGGVTGVYIIWLHLKAPANLFVTHWGGYMIALGSYAIILLALRLYQQRTIHRAMLRVCEGTASPLEKQEAGMIGKILLYEMLTGIAVLLFSSMLIITTPPLSKQLLFTQTARTENAIVTLSQERDDDSQLLITVHRLDSVQSGTGGKMTVTLENTDKGIGPLIPTLQQRFVNGFVFPKVLLSPPGDWTIRVTQQEPNRFDAVARFTVRYPDDLTAVEKQNHAHSLGAFELFLLSTAFALVLLAVLSIREQTLLLTACDHLSHPHDLPSLRRPMRLWEWIVTGGILCAIWLTLGTHNHGDTSFNRSCVQAGGEWHENLPMRFGHITSTTAGLGCLLRTPKGTFHFVDGREFQYYLIFE